MMYIIIFTVTFLTLVFGQNCPSSDWEERNTRCFLFKVEGKHHKTWHGALNDCKKQNNGQGSLVTIVDPEENQFLYDTAKTYMDQETHIWIGMSKVTTGYPYIWEDLSPVRFIQWDENEPNDFDGTQNCVRMWGYNGKWDDYDCTAKGETQHGYICQSKPAPEGVSGQGSLMPYEAYPGCCSTGDVFAILFGIIIALEIIAAVFGYLYVFKWGKQFPWQSQSGTATSFDNPVASPT